MYVRVSPDGKPEILGLCCKGAELSYSEGFIHPHFVPDDNLGWSIVIGPVIRGSKFRQPSFRMVNGEAIHTENIVISFCPWCTIPITPPLELQQPKAQA